MKLVIFDFDYTLARTAEKVKLWTRRGSEEQDDRRFNFLSPKEYNSLELNDDEFLDDQSFSEFVAVNCDKATKIESTFMFFENFLSDTNARVAILSSRPQVAQSTVLQFMKENVKNKNVNKVKNVQFKGCDSSQSKDKYNFIYQTVKKNPVSELLYFDDSVNAINYVGNNFTNDFSDVKLTTCLVNSTDKLQSLHFEKF